MERSAKMSFSTVLSAAVEGLNIEFVHVEADVSNGLPVFNMVGYLSSEVKEAGERVRTAVRNSGLDFPAKRVVINLSPATLKKRGASFDLPIALAVLASLGQIPGEGLERSLVIGELGLDGSVRKVPGVLPIMMEAARKNHVTCCIVPKENAAEAALAENMRVVGVESLEQAVLFLRGGMQLPKVRRKEQHRCINTGQENDFSDICGQENVKRAAEIAVAGGHNLLLIGPPGSGKTMAARCLPGILPPMNREESMEITKIYSVMGMLDENMPLITRRPFREVHHTATRVALTGGGLVPRPGEISLAHGGVLFLDELPEFRKSVLEVLHQPLESRMIQISRVHGKYSFPAGFMLVAAMNPCPCGRYPDPGCTCTPAQIQGYLGKISQPFLDRIDLCAEASKVRYEDLSNEKKGESSAAIRQRVCRAREIQYERYRKTEIRVNAELGSRKLKEFCELGKAEQKVMERAFSMLDLTARAYHRIIRTARTIADLDGEERIRTEHLNEAIGYRVVDRRYWRRQ